MQEVELSTGALKFEWRSDQHVPLSESQLGPSKGTPWDYFHINSVDVDPDDGNLIISGRNTWAFYKVNRSNGKVIWSLGGKASDFRFGPGAKFAFQHDVRPRTGGAFTLFDNEGGPPREASQSRGLVLSVNEKSRQANLLQQYLHSPSVMSEALGSVQDLDSGSRFIGWGQSAYFTQYDASGKAVFDGRLAAGTESYRAFKQSWQGQPAEPPDIAVSRGKTDATLYASWNGATGVAGWVVLGGTSPSQLKAVGRAARLGFETVITVPGPPPYLAVEAVGANGAALGRSRAEAVR